MTMPCGLFGPAEGQPVKLQLGFGARCSLIARLETEFIAGGVDVTSPMPPTMDVHEVNVPQRRRPYFLWDYDLTDEEVRNILRSGNETEKVWLMSRLLESAKYEDVWSYLTLQEVRTMFPKLKLKPAVRNVEFDRA